MNAFEFLKSYPYLPYSVENRPMDSDGRPSNSEIRRWLMNKAVIINCEKPRPDDEVQYPITSLIFFPKGRRVTMVCEHEDWEILIQKRWC